MGELLLAIAGYLAAAVAALFLMTGLLSWGRSTPLYQTRGYPPELKVLAPVQTLAERRRTKLASVPVLVVLIGLPFGWLWWAGSALGWNFWFLWGAGTLLLWSFNLFDLLVLDALLFCWWTPSFLVLPGTQGHPAYQDFAFHVRGFWKGTGFSLVGGMVMAALVRGVLTLAGG